jgi:hypothetical protein
VERRHIEEAFAEVSDMSRAEWASDSDVDLVDRIEANAAELRAAERDGNAEECHERARRIAAMAIDYMARGLA